MNDKPTQDVKTNGQSIDVIDKSNVSQVQYIEQLEALIIKSKEYKSLTKVKLKQAANLLREYRLQITELQKELDIYKKKTNTTKEASIQTTEDILRSKSLQTRNAATQTDNVDTFDSTTSIDTFEKKVLLGNVDLKLDSSSSNDSGDDTSSDEDDMIEDIAREIEEDLGCTTPNTKSDMCNSITTPDAQPNANNSNIEASVQSSSKESIPQVHNRDKVMEIGNFVGRAPALDVSPDAVLESPLKKRRLNSSILSIQTGDMNRDSRRQAIAFHKLCQWKSTDLSRPSFVKRTLNIYLNRVQKYPDLKGTFEHIMIWDIYHEVENLPMGEFIDGIILRLSEQRQLNITQCDIFSINMYLINTISSLVQAFCKDGSENDIRRLLYCHEKLCQAIVTILGRPMSIQGPKKPQKRTLKAIPRSAYQILALASQLGNAVYDNSDKWANDNILSAMRVLILEFIKVTQPPIWLSLVRVVAFIFPRIFTVSKDFLLTTLLLRIKWIGSTDLTGSEEVHENALMFESRATAVRKIAASLQLPEIACDLHTSQKLTFRRKWTNLFWKELCQYEYNSSAEKPDIQDENHIFLIKKGVEVVISTVSDVEAFLSEWILPQQFEGKLAECRSIEAQCWCLDALCDMLLLLYKTEISLQRKSEALHIGMQTMDRLLQKVIVSGEFTPKAECSASLMIDIMQRNRFIIHIVWAKYIMDLCVIDIQSPSKLNIVGEKICQVLGWFDDLSSKQKLQLPSSLLRQLRWIVWRHSNDRI